MSAPEHGAGASVRGGRTEAEDRFDALYRVEGPWLVRFFRRRLGNVEDAHDLTHETMLRFMRTAPSANIAIQQHYLRRIATNLLRDRSKSADTRFTKRSVPLIEGLDQENDFDQHRALAGRQELLEWEAILARLKPLTLEIFLLSRLDGHTYSDIATRLNMTVWNVKRHMTTAIAHVERNRRLR
jgi:RNA polymerase sigma-70 factor (ECF subfamily)